MTEPATLVSSRSGMAHRRDSDHARAGPTHHERLASTAIGLTTPTPERRHTRGSGHRDPLLVAKAAQLQHYLDLGPPVLPLRDPVPDVRCRRACRARPGPCLLRRRATRLAQAHRPTGRFPPQALTPSRACGGTPSVNSSGDYYPGDDLGPTPASSNASTPNGTSNDPDTETGRNPFSHHKKPW
jgi:hypothetical protein